MHASLRIIFLTALVSGCTSQPVKPMPPAEAVKAEKPQKPLMLIAQQAEQPAETKIQIGRYAQASATPTEEQKDLLEVVVKTSFPANIKTVGDAITFLLQRSGYVMADTSKQGENVDQLLNKPLPYAHRKIGPMTLQRALLLIVGQAYWMKVDPVHRLIAFDTVKEFKS